MNHQRFAAERDPRRRRLEEDHTVARGGVIAPCLEAQQPNTSGKVTVAGQTQPHAISICAAQRTPPRRKMKSWATIFDHGAHEK